MSQAEDFPCAQPTREDDYDDLDDATTQEWPGQAAQDTEQGVREEAPLDINSFLLSQPNPYMMAQNMKTETLEKWLLLATAWAADEKCSVQQELREQIEALQISGTMLLSSIQADNFGVASMAKCAEFTAEASRLQGVMNRVYLFAAADNTSSGKQEKVDSLEQTVLSDAEDDSLDELELFSPSKKRTLGGASGPLRRKRLRQKSAAKPINGRFVE